MIEDILSKEETEASVKLSSLGFSDGRGARKNLLLLSGALPGGAGAAAELALRSPNPDGALNNLERIAASIPPEVFQAPLSDTENLGRLITICGSSPFLSTIFVLNPGYYEWLFKEGLFKDKGADELKKELLESVADIETIDEAARALRLYKQKEYLRIGSRDLLGLSSLEATTSELSDLASASLDAAIEFSSKYLKRSFGEPLYTDEDDRTRQAELVVIGMGKLGGRELNFSSDIDIIYIYTTEKGETTGIEGKEDSKISLHAYFVKLSMLVNRLISSVTAEGIVFRVDLDLRPEGKGGDMANSLRSAEIYYESWGQPWERAAMLKARPIAGSMELGAEFLSMIRPFVFRKYLDFTAIEEIKSMKEKIDLSLLRRNPDAIDVKLGAGGIREIEFFCQALQLIHAGKDTEVRERTTLKAIEKLKARGYINEGEAQDLTKGYKFLRDLEHRIQIVEGRQSQAIPARKEALEGLARMMGFEDATDKKAGEFFWEAYRKTTARVHDIYRSLFYKSEGTEEAPSEILMLLSPDTPASEAQAGLAGLGFKDTEAACKNLSLLRSGPGYLHLSAKARVILQKLAPLFLMRSASSPDPDRSLTHLERFISSIGARTTFYSLLMENPRVLDELVKLFGTSVFLSRDLIEHPESLDILLSKELSIPYKKREEITAAFLEEAASPVDFEAKLDGLRRLKSQELFRVGLNDIAGALTPRQVSAQITFLAEASLEAALKTAEAELKERFGSPERGSFAILGLGKLGGKELIYGSDLDILFVYSDELEAKTTGPKVISVHEYFVKLGQRVISVLTLRTREGIVFNVDARLRPSGSAGPLVVSQEALIKYHSSSTQVWERQALVRTRAVAGDIRFGCAVVKKLEEILYNKPLTAEEAAEMLRIRKRMEVEIAKENPTRYNIKAGKGGIVDIEFLTQAFQLKYGGQKTSLRTPSTHKALCRLAREGIIPDKEFTFLKEAFSFMRLLEMRLRIVHDRPEGYLNKGSEELTTLARRVGFTGADAGDALLKVYLDYADRVRNIYANTLEALKGQAE